MEEKLSVLINSCDAYQDLWDPFFRLFEIHGGGEFENVYLNTESSGTNNKVNVINTGHYSYGARILKAINSINSEYILILLDDFFIRENIDFKSIDRMINLMNENQKIANISFDHYLNGDRTYKDTELMITNHNARYKLNLQAGIWRKDALLRYWDETDSPWLWEIYGNIKTFVFDDIFLHVKSVNDSPIIYGLNNDGRGMGVFRGKWVESDVTPLFEKHNIIVDFSKRGFLDEVNVQTELKYPVKEKIKYINKKLGFKYVLVYVQYLFSSKFTNKYSSLEEFISRKW